MNKTIDKQHSFLLYGANGYTAKLIIDLASSYGLIPILAGRNEAELKVLSEKSGFSYEVFDLEDSPALENALTKVDLMLNCAGPFVHTFQPAVMACMKTATHYLDITGEIDVFEFLARQSKNAMKSNIMLLPGMGFDVVPSDCMAAWLKSMMPDAQNLSLAIKTEGRASRGTMNTAVESLHKGGMIRKNGKLKKVKNAFKIRQIDFGDGPEKSMTIPWGDISTAYYSTGIENILTYMANPPINTSIMRLSGYFSWILKSKMVKNFLKNKIRKGPDGPDAEARRKNKSWVWGEVSNEDGKRISAVFEGPEGYILTANTTLMGIRKILNGQFSTGFQTPSSVFGDDFILQLNGTKRYLH